MSTHHVRAAAEVRDRIDHPVVDADGHTLEFRPALDEYLVAEGALDATALMQTHMNAWDAMAPEVRAATRAIRPPFWGLPAEHTLDLATTTLPGLMYERLPELGIDVSVVYPSFGVGFAHVPHDDLRRAACRAVNRYRINAKLKRLQDEEGFEPSWADATLALPDDVPAWSGKLAPKNK